MDCQPRCALNQVFRGEIADQQDFGGFEATIEFGAGGAVADFKVLAQVRPAFQHRTQALFGDDEYVEGACTLLHMHQKRRRPRAGRFGRRFCCVHVERPVAIAAG